jgi:general stress protein 26
MDLKQVQEKSAELSPWAHIATVGKDGFPDVAPVHPAWKDGTIWIMTFGDSVKVRNIRHQPQIAMHWQVTAAGDGVEVWGKAAVHDDLGTKKQLWEGVFDYDLNLFSPGGPEGSPNTVFVAVKPERALFLKNYGINGRETWRA